MPLGEIKKEKQYIVLAVSFAFVQLFALLLWFLEKQNGSEDDLVRLYSDKLFLSSIFAACCGAIIAITAKSRRHYYKHIQEKIKTGNHDDTPFDQEQHQRNRHANLGLLIAIAGVVSLLVSGLVLYLGAGEY